jgi:hypothetical protein
VIARASLLAVLLLSAIASDAQRIVLGPEQMLGSRELGATWNSDVLPAASSDGDEVLVVYSTSSRRGISAARFDRNGALVRASVVRLFDGALAYALPMRVAWMNGFYRVFFVDATAHLHVLRVTRDGIVVADTAMPFANNAFDIATDGREIVLVSAGDAILRFGGDDTVIGTIPIARALPYGERHRAVAYGGGRFAIITLDETQLATRFLRDGILDTAVRVSDAHAETLLDADVTWTGATFVAGWVDCQSNSYYERPCLTQWTPLTSNGEAAGPIRVVDHFIADTSERPGVTVSPIDDETVLLTWHRTPWGIAQAQRFRVSGAAAGARIDVEAPPAAVRPDSGPLFVFDGALRVATTHAGDGNALAFNVGVPRLQREELLAIASSRDALAVARVTHRDASSLGAIAVSILGPDGALLREVPLAGRTQSFLSRFAMASDGEEFFAIGAGSDGVWFYRLNDPLRRVQLADETTWGIRMQLAWSGTELIAIWQYGDLARVVRLDRDGTRRGDSFVDAPWVQHLAARDARTLFAWIGSPNLGHVGILDPAGLQNRDDVFTGVYELAVASNGKTDACIAAADYARSASFAVRRADGAFVETATLRGPGQYDQVRSVSIVATPRGFVGAWQTNSAPHVHLAALTETGFVQVETAFGKDAILPRLVEQNGHLFVAYLRSIEELPNDGISRVFLRSVTIADERSLPHQDRPQ